MTTARPNDKNVARVNHGRVSVDMMLAPGECSMIVVFLA